MCEGRIGELLTDTTLAARLLNLGLHHQAVAVLSRVPIYQVKRMRSLNGQVSRPGPSRLVQSLCRYTPEVGLSSVFLRLLANATALPCRCGTCNPGLEHRDICRHRFPDIYREYVRLLLGNALLLEHLARYRTDGALLPLSPTDCYHLYVAYRSGQIQSTTCAASTCGAHYFYIPDLTRLRRCPACGHHHPQAFVHRVARPPQRQHLSRRGDLPAATRLPAG